MVRVANVNDKEVAKPLLGRAKRLLTSWGRRIGHVIADRQYYSADVFDMVKCWGPSP